MELYLNSTTLHTVYSYIGWDDLRKQSNVPDYFWMQYCINFCKDEQFRKKFDEYWGKNIRGIPYKDLFLYFINSLVDFPYCLPNILYLNLDFVIKVVRKLPNHITFMDARFRSNKQVILAAITSSSFMDSGCLRILDESLKADLDIISIIISKYSSGLKYISDAFKADRNIVLKAVVKDGMNLEYASSELKNDRHVVLTAIKNNPYSFRYADPQLTLDRSYILEALQYNAEIIKILSSEFRADKEIMLIAVMQNPSTLEFSDPCLRGDRDIVIAAVSKMGYTLKFASDDLRSDREITLIAVKNWGEDVLKYVHESLRSDASWKIKAMKYISRWCLD